MDHLIAVCSCLTLHNLHISLEHIDLSICHSTKNLANRGENLLKLVLVQNTQEHLSKVDCSGKSLFLFNLAEGFNDLFVDLLQALLEGLLIDSDG